MDHKEIAKLITLLENEPDRARDILKKLPKRICPVIGFTGSPGVGKSTLIDQVIARLRSAGKTVAVVAVDPSSPFSQGAFLGDRVRMKKHFLDEGVFIRSMASRGALGGLNESIYDVVELLEAVGFDYVLIETVGVGQAEVEVRYVADVVALVLSPGFGDEMQLLKAGVMEIADIYVVNKSDLEGNDSLYDQLIGFLTFAGRDALNVVKTSALNGSGIEELVDRIITLWKNFAETEKLKQLRKERLRHHTETLARRTLQKYLSAVDSEDPYEGVELALKFMCERLKYGQGGGT
ncbi:MAG: LAO/AO transport system ATPase [Thermotoga sp. 50_1627]|uniref:methylmalonyl Co-A mutase-associated GTPase MeaB n=1 Tax=Pseudothermotoga sp. TaxID=2033661 RepID=UPI00076DA595|nr:MAG: LAO/AO transport system ATPase [Thermotoga sp. 50_64]KUK24544.1 MAG: LAO/AO transport system ATPase [Thermotoga sp. 50_1627]MBC7116339.1 methylmalonyl Co-A mutase-associated GTPase MeaB [Pseudothermotoga sp.]MDK2923586.1 GTPase [Pseudothermotoga sp.]HBT40383.1 methylmalonyl Co-A mutase-associated GTPase MeaB [Pseudothermotoga sp.]